MKHNDKENLPRSSKIHYQRDEAAHYRGRDCSPVIRKLALTPCAPSIGWLPPTKSVYLPGKIFRSPFSVTKLKSRGLRVNRTRRVWPASIWIRSNPLRARIGTSGPGAYSI